MLCNGVFLALLSLSLKFFMLTQMAFWVHCYPELIFMKAKKVCSLYTSEKAKAVSVAVWLVVSLQEELHSKIVLYTSSLLLIAGAYAMM